MKKTFIYLILLTFSFNFNSETFSSCPNKPEKKLEPINAKFIRKIKHDKLVGAQGINVFKINKEKRIALSSGYWKNNTTIFDYKSGRILNTVNLSKRQPSRLLASVFFMSNKLWWTSYREDKIYTTDLALKLKNELFFSGLNSSVGITGIIDEQKILLISREKNRLIIFEETNFKNSDSYKIDFVKQAPYDVDYYNKCIFFVESSAGKIWVLNSSEILNIKTSKLEKYFPKFFKNLHSEYFSSVKPSLWFSDSLRIQHQDIYKDQLFVIDTDNYQIIQIFLRKNSYRKINLPIKHIFRGLAIPMKGKVLLTGFETKEKISEDKTAIFEFSF